MWLAPTGSSFTVQLLASKAVSVTVTIVPTTVVTAEAGITPTLAVVEQVHVKATRGSNGSLTAVQVRIQKCATSAAHESDADTPGAGGKGDTPKR